MHGSFTSKTGLLALKNKMIAASVPPGILAASDWHHSVACKAYEQYQLLSDDADLERKHTRYVNKMAVANSFLRAYQFHTQRGDALLH